MPLFMKERKTRFRKKVSTVWGSPRPKKLQVDNFN